MNEKVFLEKEKAIITTLIVLMVTPYFLTDVMLLDNMIILNIIFTLLILIVTIWTEKIKNISFYPSLFLLSTFFNLIINISVTYLIIEKGNEFDGKLIRNYHSLIFNMESKTPVRSIIIFIIIILTGVLIIKRCTYIYKKTACYEKKILLEKLTAIDAEYNSGTINEIKVFTRKNEACKENDFFCSLVEAAKFISIYEKIRIIIIAVSLFIVILCAIIAYFLESESIIETVNIYFPLIIGNGILCLIPSIILSVSMGIIIMRIT